MKNSCVATLSVDWEDFPNFVRKRSLSSLPLASRERIELQTHYLLDLLDERELKVTFFCVAYLAKQFPFLVKRIHSRGHGNRPA